MGFKLLLQQVAAAEFRRSQAGQVGERENLFGHELLEIQPQEAAVERGNGVLPVQREIGGQHRAARYADDDVYILHQGFFPAADVYLLPVELLQDAVAQGGRPCAAAGKHQYDISVVAVGIILALAVGFKAVAAVQIDFVDGGYGLVTHQRTGRKQRGGCGE